MVYYFQKKIVPFVNIKTDSDNDCGFLKNIYAITLFCCICILLLVIARGGFIKKKNKTK